ncbi:MAG: HPr family phosphocarrier protein [Caldilineaceae bacterium]|nr:HPr family phosphocarrier protein [Caldilineaceae bacterium]MCB0095557.1 HPr family phosphocarrier protein [Caldilineaceae bacterium]MCB0140669.1 HPr family phosphocarrier protein [Caldilineaceae bacterium]
MDQPQTITLKINHPLGLHLRKSRDVVQVASQYQALITIQNLTRSTSPVDAKSIIQLVQLQARQGHELHLQATGPDALEALQALASQFDDLTSAAV